MESAKRVTPAMSRVRPVFPRLPYVPPPPPDRLDPRSINPAAAARLLDTLSPNADLARALVNAFRGISPVMAHEIVFRATGSSETRAGDVNAASAEPLARETLALLEPLRTTVWSPRIYRERGEHDPGEVVAFSPIPMTHLAAEPRQPGRSMSEARHSRRAPPIAPVRRGTLSVGSACSSRWPRRGKRRSGDWRRWQPRRRGQLRPSGSRPPAR